MSRDDRAFEILAEVPEGLTLETWQTPQYLHWAFQHLGDFRPTESISRGDGPVAELAPAPEELSSIGLSVDGRPTTVGEVMASTVTDGWIVTQRGAVLEEHYHDGMTADTGHLLMSVSKSLVGMVAGALVGEGVLDTASELARYVPALGSTGYAGATVRHLLDMRSGIAFSEVYLDPMAEVRLLEQALDWAPRTAPGVPATMYDFLLTLRQKAPHGGVFEYRSGETDVLGWICEAASGIRMPQLMSHLLWSKLGAQNDAYIGVDSAGTGMFDGGINACLRDLARFGAVVLGDGVSLTGEQVVSPEWIADIRTGEPDSRAAFAASPTDTGMPGGMYRNQFWLPYPGDNVLLCQGIHGQMIYINRSAGVVAAKLSSWPLPQEPAHLFATIAAFDEIAAQLS